MRLGATRLTAVASPRRRRSLAEQVAEIFAAATPGYFVDPSDYPRCYQDRFSLANPCTGAPGELFGQCLDLSQGLAEGAELRGTGAVNKVGTVTDATYNTTTGEGTLVRIDASNQSFVQLTGLTGAFDYRTTIANTGSVLLSVRPGGSSAAVLITISAGQSATFFFTGNATMSITCAAGTGAFTLSTCKHIAGNHYRAPSDAARPVYAAMPNGIVLPQGDGIGTYLLSPAINGSGSAVVSVVAGVRKTDDTTARVVLNQNSTSPAISLRAPGTDAATSFSFRIVGPGGTSVAEYTNANAAAPVTAVLSAKYVTHPSALQVNSNAAVNGGTPDPAITAFANAAFAIGANANATLFFSGFLGPQVMAFKPFTDAQLLAARRYCDTKLGGGNI